jgi:NAD(P)-dependent dehydrogenase (short-subunit alcohol dehydrogenase family)
VNRRGLANLAQVPLTDIEVALWDKVMAVNVRGPFLMAKHVVPHMRAKRYGKIVNIGSGTAYKAWRISCTMSVRRARSSP